MLTRNRFQYDENDKENMANLNIQPKSASKLFGKKGDLDKKDKIAGRFGRLLVEATNEKREEEDNLLAIDQQAEEAVAVLSEWLQESQDFQLAQELAEALQKEDDSQRRLEIIQGEAEALKVAVEEKRKIKASAQSKTDREREDEALAKRIADDEVRYLESKRRQYEEDEKLSLQLLEEEERHKTSYRQRVYEDDAKFCSILQQEEEEEARRKAQRLAEDAKFASEFKDLDDSVIADCKDDKECSSVADEKSVVSDDDDEEEDAKADAKDDSAAPLSFRNAAEAKLNLRAKFQAKKRIQYASIYQTHPKKHDETYMSQLWENANAEVDDVAGAICLSLVLPNVAKLQVKTDLKESLVRIDARRWIEDANANTKYSDNTQYIAEFVLSGQNIEISSERVYHDYSPETGILFIYVEDICLDVEKQSKEEQQQQLRANGNNAGTSSHGNNNHNSLASRTIKQNILNKMKNNLLRIFTNRK